MQTLFAESLQSLLLNCLPLSKGFASTPFTHSLFYAYYYAIQLNCQGFYDDIEKYLPKHFMMLASVLQLAIAAGIPIKQGRVLQAVKLVTFKSSPFQ